VFTSRVFAQLFNGATEMENRMHMGNQMFAVRMFLRSNKHLAHYGRAVDNVLAKTSVDNASTSQLEFSDLMQRIASFNITDSVGSAATVGLLEDAE
jgi:hypothetical protein